MGRRSTPFPPIICASGISQGPQPAVGAVLSRGRLPDRSSLKAKVTNHRSTLNCTEILRILACLLLHHHTILLPLHIFTLRPIHPTILLLPLHGQNLSLLRQSSQLFLRHLINLHLQLHQPLKPTEAAPKQALPANSSVQHHAHELEPLPRVIHHQLM